MRDAGDPVEIAKNYSDQGADEICFLDITASNEERKTMIDVVERTAGQVFVPLTVGGGVRTLDDVRQMLLAGADKVSINTAAVKNPDFVREAAQKFGSQCIVVAIDARSTGEGKWEVFTHGGRNGTGIDAVEWAQKMEDYGAGEILLTSMDKDGTKSGYDLPLTRTISRNLKISCEFKNCLLLDGVQVPHFSYVGDSVLGNKAHLGAGVTCSNLRLDQSEVPVQLPDGSRRGSGLRKLGALVGDAAEVGCNAVLNPGSILGRRALVMPTMAFRGTLKANSIAYIKEKIETAPRMD